MQTVNVTTDDLLKKIGSLQIQLDVVQEVNRRLTEELKTFKEDRQDNGK